MCWCQYGWDETRTASKMSEKVKDHRSNIRNFKSSCEKKAWKKKIGSNGIRTHDLCDTGAVLYQLSYQASLRGRRVNNQYGAIKKARSATPTRVSLSCARVSRAPYIFHAPATQATIKPTGSWSLCEFVVYPLTRWDEIEFNFIKDICHLGFAAKLHFTAKRSGTSKFSCSKRRIWKQLNNVSAFCSRFLSFR